MCMMGLCTSTKAEEAVMSNWVAQWEVPSSSSDKMYIVSRNFVGEYACACIGWTRHVPRKDCRHIKQVKAYPYKYLVESQGPIGYNRTAEEEVKLARAQAKFWPSGRSKEKPIERELPKEPEPEVRPKRRAFDFND
jgi:hypothetical protein